MHLSRIAIFKNELNIDEIILISVIKYVDLFMTHGHSKEINHDENVIYL